MNASKAVEEVWTLRETVAKEILAVPRDKRVSYINESTRKACVKLGIKCRTASRTHTKAA